MCQSRSATHAILDTLNDSAEIVSGRPSTGRWLFANLIRSGGCGTPNDWINADHGRLNV